MCGIAGILSADRKIIDQKKSIKKMIATLQHRGPDGWGIYVTQNMALGHTRLSIIDIGGGNQPMMSERYAIVYNGEIYNYIELREDLIALGEDFCTQSDTEVILKAFEVYGTAALSKFNGQFAFLLWDKKENRLIIARDRYGIRPLYVLKHNKNYYFSSEMKAFDTINGYQRTFNMQNLLDHALYWNTINDDTIFKDILSLPGGTFEIYSPGEKPKRHRYYEIGESQRDISSNENTAIEEFTELLKDSVKLRLRSDVPVANYLSGGIDSSAVTYLTTLNNRKKYKTFSVSFEDADYDESVYQREMVSHINSQHVDLEVNCGLINDNFLDATYYFERPVFRTAPVPLYLLSKEVQADGTKVVLTGEGADEILYGYDSYKELKLLEFWKRDPKSKLRPLLIKKLYPHLQHYKDPKRYLMMKMYYEEFLNNFNNELVGLNIRMNNNKILLNFINKDFGIVFDEEKALDKIRGILPDNYYSWSLLQQNQFLEMKTLLSGYLLSSQGDRMSMAHSVEARYPFLDHRIVENLFYCSSELKLRGFSQKHILKRVFRNYLPKSIIDRPKLPYQAPDLKSFYKKGGLTDNSEYFLSKDMIDEYGLFDYIFINRFLKKFEKGIPVQIGYRNNMLITFILSCQMVKYWIRNPKKYVLDNRLKKVEIIDC